MRLILLTPSRVLGALFLLASTTACSDSNDSSTDDSESANDDNADDDGSDSDDADDDDPDDSESADDDGSDSDDANDSESADDDGSDSDDANDSESADDDDPDDDDANDDGSNSDDAAASETLPFELPADALSSESQGAIVIEVSNSSSAHLPNGVYLSPYSANASTRSSIGFLPAGLAILMQSLQVQMSIPREQQDHSMSCEGPTDILIRYGAPPTGNNQLLVESCEIEYTYDASDGSYTGSFEGRFADGLLAPDGLGGADIEGKFTFIYTE